MVGYPSGQRGETVNLLAYAFTGSNPVPTTISASSFLSQGGVFTVRIAQKMLLYEINSPEIHPLPLSFFASRLKGALVRGEIGEIV